MTAPTVPTIVQPSSERFVDNLITDDFMTEVVKGYEDKTPDKNDTSRTALSDHATIGDLGSPGDADEPKPETPAEPAKPDAPVKKGDKLGDAKSEEKAPEPAKPLATEFKVYGADGDELDRSDVLSKIGKIEIEVKGEQRGYTLDALCRMAKSGIHNEKLYTEAEAAIAEMGAIETRAVNAEASVTKQNAFIERLLTDPPFRQQVEDQWAAHNTPESRAERAERKLAEVQQERAGQGVQQQAATFYTSEVKPKLEALIQQFPTLTVDEVLGRFNRLTAPLGAQVRPEHFATIRAILADDLPAYAASVHDDRSRRDAALRQTRESNTLLKKRVASGARPTGRPATAAESKPTRKAPRTMAERQEQMLDDVLAEIAGG